MANYVAKLPAEVAAKYDLVDYGNGGSKQVWGKHGTVDLETLTLKKADRLYAEGWTKLKLKEAKKEPATPAKQ
jgi:hypothetical protein